MKTVYRDVLYLLTLIVFAGIIGIGFWRLIFTPFWWIPSHLVLGLICTIVGIALQQGYQEKIGKI